MSTKQFRMNTKQLLVTERIQTLEDAYRERGYNREDLLIPNPHPLQVAANSFMDACVLTEALNEGWKHTPGNIGYYPVFYRTGGGSGFSFSDYAYAYSFAFVGARLVFRTEELAEYAGKQFLDVYRDFMTYQTEA